MSESRKSGQYPPFEFQTQPRTDMNVSSVLVISIESVSWKLYMNYSSGLSLKFERGILTTFPRFRHKLLPFKDSFPR